MNRKIQTTEDMETLGQGFGRLAKAGDVLVLTGALGAGKTTFTRGFGEALELQTPVSSPTFIVARTHSRKNLDAPAFVHIDAYRLASAAELDDLDIDVDSSIVVAEWAAPFAKALSDSWLEILIERPTAGLSANPSDDEPRSVTFTIHGPDEDRYQRFLEAAEES